MHGPVGIPEHGATNQNGVSLPGPNDLIGLLCGGDQTDCTGGHARGTYRSGELNLVSRSMRDGHSWQDSSGRAVDQVGPGVLEHGGEAHRVIDCPAVIPPIRCGDPDQNRNVIAYGFTNLNHHFEQQTHSILERAAVVVCPVIAKG